MSNTRHLRPGLGGLPPKPMNAPPPGLVSPGVQAGINNGVFIGRYVIIYGANGGLFIYDGTPALGNPPVYSITNAIEDPYGNDNIIPGVTSYSGTPYGSGSFAITMQEAGITIWYWNGTGWSAGYGTSLQDWGLGIAQSYSEFVESPAGTSGQLSRQLNALFFSLVATLNTGPTAGISFLAASGDQTGNQDVVNIITQLGLSFIILLPGTFYINQQVVVGNENAIAGCNASFGVPIGNYGLGSLPLQGSIIKCTDTFANPNSGSACILLSQAGSQGGGQRLTNFSLDCSGLPSGNNLHGIGVFGAIAAATFQDLTVYGGPNGVAGSLGGDCFHAVSGGGQPPDLLTLFHNHFAGGSGWGATVNGVADSYVAFNECTGNGLGGWNITNGNNSRYVSNKGEQSPAGPGWKITFATGFTGILHMLTNTCQDNFEDGMQVTGPGTGTLKVSDFAYDSDGQNGGGGGGNFAGMNIFTFAGTVQLELLKGRVGASYPEYGLSITNLTGKVTLDNVDAQAITQGFNWDYTGTVVFGEYTFTPAGGVWYVVGNAGAPAFGAGWSAIGAGNVPVRFRRVGPYNVEIEGAANNATAANAAPIFTLPAGMRPTYQQIYALVENGTVYGNSIVVQTNGEVTPFNNAGAGNYFLGDISVGLD